MPESSAPIQSVGRTGEACREAGPYRSESRVRLVVFFRQGDKFPNDAEGRSTSWTLLRDDLAQ
jgi:hypothetical protein